MHKTKKTTTTTCQNLWDAAKAVLREIFLQQIPILKNISKKISNKLYK